MVENGAHHGMLTNLFSRRTGRDWTIDSLILVDKILHLLQVYKQSSIHQQLGSIDIGTQVTAQEDGRACKITWDAGTTQRYPAFHVLSLLFVLQILLVELCLDCTGQQRVAPDVVFSKCARRRLDEREDTSFGWRVVALVRATDKRADGRDTDYGTTGGRLYGELLCAGLNGVEGTGEVGG